MLQTNNLILPFTISIIVFLILFIYYQYQGFKVKNNSIVTQNPDSVLYDAFGRARISNINLVFESKQINDNLPLLWNESLTAGSGITSAYNKNRASTIITTTNGISGTFVRQTFRRFDYRPGKSQNIMMTSVIKNNGFDNGANGVIIRIGNFDENNGIFFEYSENIMHCVIRTKTNGTVVNLIKIKQTDWSIDKMDGKGKSGLTVDWSKIQIFAIDFGWLGSGRVRFGLFINGINYTIHEYLSSNITPSVYMSTPTNPLRFEVITTTSSPAISTEQICSAVSVEGDGTIDSGIIRSQSNDNDVYLTNNNVNYVIQSFRLKGTSFSTTIPEDIKVLNLSTTASEHLTWKLMFEPTYSFGNGTSIPTSSWIGVSNSVLEQYEAPVVADITAGEGSRTIVLASGYASSNYLGIGGGETSSGGLNHSLLLLGKYINGDSQTLALTASPLSGNGISVRSLFSWKEI